MKRYLSLTLGCISLFSITACSKPQPQTPPPAQADFRPAVTIREYMEHVVEPSADNLWNAVSSISDAKGTRDIAPQTDEEWGAVQNSAVALVEAMNVVLIPGRRVANPGEQADDPKVELHPDEIQKLIDSDRKSFEMYAHGLQDAAAVALKAVQAKNANALLDAGEGIDKACENCHLKYWYPNEAQNAQ